MNDLFKDKIFVKSLELCDLYIEPVVEFSWFILVSKIEAKNMLELTQKNREILFKEINHVSEIVNEKLKPDQINIAMLGNMTPWLHCHIIARYKNDLAWPNSTFGFKATKASKDDLNKLMIF